MAPAKKKNFTIELPEECGKVPKLTSLNQSGYVLWDEVDEDLQAFFAQTWPENANFGGKKVIFGLGWSVQAPPYPISQMPDAKKHVFKIIGASK